MKKGFTLAEVLVSLAIIGVIAALTVPTLIKKTEKQQWITSYKTAFNTVNQATKMIMANNGGTLSGVWGAMQHSEMYQEYLKYLNVVKECENQSNEGTCFAARYEAFNGDLRVVSSQYSVILSNGASLAFLASAGTGGIIEIDTNGKKGPNVFGKDYHLLYIFENSDPVKPQSVGFNEAMILSMCPSDLTGDEGFTCGIRLLRGDYGEDY